MHYRSSNFRSSGDVDSKAGGRSLASQAVRSLGLCYAMHCRSAALLECELLESSDAARKAGLQELGVARRGQEGRATGA